MIQIHIIRSLFIHYVSVDHYILFRVPRSEAWPVYPESEIWPRKPARAYSAPALQLLVSWPGREAPCHALKCRHKTPAPPAIKCAEWQLCRRSGRCGPALYCSTLLRLLASPLQPCPHTPAGGHCSYSLVLSYLCISSLALALNRF